MIPTKSVGKGLKGIVKNAIYGLSLLNGGTKVKLTNEVGMCWKHELTKSVEQILENFIWTDTLFYEENCHIGIQLIAMLPSR